MKMNKSGFTLMEIMVVIIVIAVMASVAGPMIGSITDQGRASATKSKLSSLKSAMLAYQSDVGRIPYAGNKKCKSSYSADLVLSYNDAMQNCLSGNETTALVSTAGTAVNKYSRKWKGPYMDSDPSDFMFDSWGNEIQYVAENNNIWLWSYGADGQSDLEVQTITGGMDALAKCVSQEGYEGDDILLSVARVKWKIQ